MTAEEDSLSLLLSLRYINSEQDVHFCGIIIFWFLSWRELYLREFFVELIDVLDGEGL